MKKLFAAFLIAQLVPSYAQASAIVDQSNVVTFNTNLLTPIGKNISTANGTFNFSGLQFITAGMSGQLTEIDLQLSRGPNLANLVIANNIIFDSSGHVTSYNQLGELPVSGLSNNVIPGFTSFNTTALNIFLSSGSQFGIALVPDAGSGSFLWLRGPDVYSGGDGYLGVTASGTGNDVTWLNRLGAVAPQKLDYGFRTWMDAVPEPQTWAMMLMGFGFVGFAMRRRQKVAVSYT